MPTSIPYIKVFLSSPGDVAPERKVVLDTIDRFPNRPAFRDKVAFRVVAWDKIGADTPMIANMTPQHAINARLPLPSDCDIVITIFWTRMGTPFVDDDGVEYMSGTHWELMDALKSPDTIPVIYQRLEEPQFKIDEHDKRDQYERLRDFFSSEMFYKDGLIKSGINVYQDLDDFRVKFETHFEELVLQTLERFSEEPEEPPVEFSNDEHVHVVETVEWPAGKSPFPGLRAFTKEDEPIFFGRERETDRLVNHVARNRFVGVIGASGSGKSSLVWAGLLPQLEANAINNEDTGSKDWIIATLTPGADETPIHALIQALLDSLPSLQNEERESLIAKLESEQENSDSSTSEITDTLLNIKPASILELVDKALASEKDWVELLIFVDQFEELFTIADTKYAIPFAGIITALATHNRVRIVVTMRADFYQRAVEHNDLAELLRTGSFPLSTPKREALEKMILRPAEYAGLTLEDGLVERILDDTGDEPGNLALMAYALDELYYEGKEDTILTIDEYERVGGVQGAIGRRAETSFNAMPQEVQDTIKIVFRELVEVDERGTATRQRIPISSFVGNPNALKLIHSLTKARLLVTSYDKTLKKEIVEVAHEALLRSWPRLAGWIENTQEDLRLLRQVRNAAHEWDRHGRPSAFLWQHERLAPVYKMQKNLGVQFNLVEKEFIRPEAERRFEEFKTHRGSSRRDLGEDLRERMRRQMFIIDRLLEIGASAIPVLIECLSFSINSGVKNPLKQQLMSFDPKVFASALELSDEQESTKIINWLEQNRRDIIPLFNTTTNTLQETMSNQPTENFLLDDSTNEVYQFSLEETQEFDEIDPKLREQIEQRWHSEELIRDKKDKKRKQVRERVKRTTSEDHRKRQQVRELENKRRERLRNEHQEEQERKERKRKQRQERERKQKQDIDEMLAHNSYIISRSQLSGMLWYETLLDHGVAILTDIRNILSCEKWDYGKIQTIELLRRMRKQEVVPILIEAQSDQVRDVRWSATKALGDYYWDDRVVSALEKMLEDPDREVRFIARYTLESVEKQRR